MNKLGNYLSVKHGWAFKGEFFTVSGEQSILTPGNFYEEGGFKDNCGKERYYCGEYPSEYLCHKGDLIVAMTEQAAGLLGSTAIVPDDDKYLHNQRIGLISCNETRLDKMYAYYLFMTKSVREQIRRSSSGTKVKHTSPEKIYDVLVSIPDLPSQYPIATTLAKIDEKIVLNKRINAELEAMAKTIYDYWFMQFDFPDENGKPYRTSGGAMEWSELLKLKIPKGWKVQQLETCVSKVSTGLNPRDNFKLGNGTIKYITVKNLCTDGTIDFTNCDTIDTNAQETIHERSDISIGDILFASIAPLGRCYLIQDTPTNWDINESVFSIRPEYGSVTSEYLYMYFMSNSFITRASSSSTGSIFKGIRIGTLHDMPIIVPPKPVIDAFSDCVGKFLCLKYEKNLESEELTNLRDWLLPMLMNGQATVE